jgi:hypothetical protein
LDVVEAPPRVTGPSRRVVAVLGYAGRGHELHPVCARRLERAAALSTGDDVVVLTGWARHHDAAPEAELMRRAWTGCAREVVVDPHARTTLENALNAARVARDVGAGELWMVTSGWHARRAGVFFRWALRGSGIRLVDASTEERRAPRAQLRELWCWAVAPAQIARARR